MAHHRGSQAREPQVRLELAKGGRARRFTKEAMQVVGEAV
jgi:hypothetical protein